MSLYESERFELAIVSAATKLQFEKGGSWHFRELYPLVFETLGTESTSHIAGCIRSWVEERSPHSRQHYFRGGRRIRWKIGERPLMFVNDILGERNTENGWRPYVHVRGDGWRYSPKEAQRYIAPTSDVLDRAGEEYLRTGMQGARPEHVPMIALPKAKKLRPVVVDRPVVVNRGVYIHNMKIYGGNVTING